MIMIYSWNWHDSDRRRINVKLAVQREDKIDLFDREITVPIIKPEWLFTWLVNRAKSRLMKKFRKQCKDRVAYEERLAMARRIKEIPQQ